MLDLDTEIKTALKAKNKTALTAWRAVKTKANVKLTEAGRGDGKPLSEDEMLGLIRREVKERQESNEYLSADSPDHVENSSIIAVLEGFLPKALDEAATEAAVKKAIADVGAQGPQDMGKVMGALKSVAGLEMGKASARVKALLAG